MLFIYDGQTQEIMSFYNTDFNPLESILRDYSDKVDVYNAVVFDNDDDVIKRPLDYRLVFVDGKPIAYAKKIDIAFTLSKNPIENDGVDSTILSVDISNTHVLDDITSVDLLVGKQTIPVNIENNHGQLEITSTVEGSINIYPDFKFFKRTFIALEVV